MHSPTLTATHSTLLSHSSGSSPTPGGGRGRGGGGVGGFSGRISGATERQLVLLCANVVLLLIGATVVIVSAVLLGSFLLPSLDFVSALFPAAPALLLCAGLLTCCAAAVGLSLWRQRRRERSAGFRLLAALLVLSCAACLASSCAAFLLRETIAHTFSSTRVQAQFRRFYSDASVSSRWDPLQSAYGCCGGGETGYFDYADETGDIKKGEQVSGKINQAVICSKM